MNSRFQFDETFSIDGTDVGAGQGVFIIAEAGVSHFGDLQKALKLVDLAHEAGADAVKFQIFDPGIMFSRNSNGWKERMESRCLPFHHFIEIRDYCKDKELTFFATAHDERALEFLHSLEVPVYKVGSGELRNWDFIETVLGLGRPVIVSTGMYSVEEVEELLDIVARSGNREFALLHCVTSYPTSPDLVNLNVIDTFRNDYQCIVGYSDHTEGMHVPLAAVALGAKIIEKHVSLDFDIEDAQDWRVSCGPQNFKKFVDMLREVEMSLGSGEKVPTSQELANKCWATKSLVLKSSLEKGQKIERGNVMAKRPGIGIPPTEINSVVGRVVREGILANTSFSWDDLV